MTGINMIKIELKKSLFDYPTEMIKNILGDAKGSIFSFFMSFGNRIKRGEISRENMYVEMIDLDIRDSIIHNLLRYYNRSFYSDETIEEMEEFILYSDEIEHYKREFYKKYNDELKDFEKQLLGDMKYGEADKYFKAVYKESGLSGHKTQAPRRKSTSKKHNVLPSEKNCPVKVNFRGMI